MKIKKVAQTPGVLATVSTSKIDSDKDTYSCNYLNDNSVVVSLTEPSDGKVWLERGKNLFNPNTDVELIDSFRSYYDRGEITQASGYHGLKIRVKPNTTYSTKTNIPSGDYHNLCYFDENMVFLASEPFNKEPKIFTTPDNCVYVTIAVKNTYDWFEIEEGSSFLPKKIHTKNNNGVYEEFYNEENREVYSTSEQRIGTWIDGKPLYRLAGIYSETIAKDTLTVLASAGSGIIDKVTRYEVLSRINITVDNRSHEAPVYTSTGNFCIKPSTSIHEAIFVAEYTKITD